MWEREAEFAALLLSVQQRASRASIDALAQLAVEDHKQVRCSSYSVVLVSSADTSRGLTCSICICCCPVPVRVSAGSATRLCLC